jgi:hypothetical protein
LGRGKTFSYNLPSFFSFFFFFAAAQEVIPLTNLSSLQEKVLTFLLKGANSPWPL